MIRVAVGSCSHTCHEVDCHGATFVVSLKVTTQPANRVRVEVGNLVAQAFLL